MKIWLHLAEIFRCVTRCQTDTHTDKHTLLKFNIDWITTLTDFRNIAGHTFMFIQLLSLSVDLLLHYWRFLQLQYHSSRDDSWNSCVTFCILFCNCWWVTTNRHHFLLHLLHIQSTLDSLVVSSRMLSIPTKLSRSLPNSAVLRVILLLVRVLSILTKWAKVEGQGAAETDFQFLKYRKGCF